MNKESILILALSLFFLQCNEPEKPADKAAKKTHSSTAPVPKRADMTYHVLAGKDSVKKIRSRYSGNDLYLIALVNRTDTAHITGLDPLLIPDDLSADRMQYFPFPFRVGELKDIRKIIFFSYPAQAYAAYDNGHLTYTGPTNMGRKKDPTPTGLFFTNWKAEETKSTFNDEWDLKWNFNIENKEGVGWHEYAMPGYPASHSCLRLTEADAKQLYEWANEWTLAGKDSVLAPGTPVIVFGSYPFGSPKPWLALAQQPKALDMTEAQIMGLVTPHKAEIIAAQQKQDAVSSKQKTAGK